MRKEQEDIIHHTDFAVRQEQTDRYLRNKVVFGSGRSKKISESICGRNLGILGRNKQESSSKYLMVSGSS